MRSNDSLIPESEMASSGIVGLRELRMPKGESKPNELSSNTDHPHVNASLPFDIATYARVLQQMTKFYARESGEIPNSLGALSPGSHLSSMLPGLDRLLRLKSHVSSDSTEATVVKLESKNGTKLVSEESSPPSIDEKLANNKAALDLSNPGLKSLYSNFRRIKLHQIKPKLVEDVWVESDVKLTWTDSKIAAYNPAQKLFMCVDCESVGFLSRVVEHWLGAHGNMRVFNCPRCPYTSAWSRCVKMHLTRQHNEQFADTKMWKENVTLMEVTQLMQELRTNVENKIDATNSLSDKRFYCPHCPYATDRRDLYTRHENIHKDDKPFHCYVCFKQFNRADHVKKHFVRMHPDHEYDISKIRKQQQTKNSTNTEPSLVTNGIKINNNVTKVSPVPCKWENNSTPINVVKFETLQCKSSSPTPNEDHLKKPFEPIKSAIPEPVADLAIVVDLTTNSVSPTRCPSSTVLKSPVMDNSRTPKRRGDRAYTCPYCQWSGTDNWCLKRHMNTHIKPFACIMCDYKAARAERLSTHVWKVHSKRICSKCNFLADTQEVLLEHIREEHHNNPYSRRHICASCGMSFDTRANLETHIHLSHSRPRSPKDIVQITPISLAEKNTSISKDHLLCRSPQEDTLSLICPIEECSLPFDSSGKLADHVRLDHGGMFSSRCPHCKYNLTKDELSKDHWLTHHDDVCNACVHVFTSVYGPQMWKKVHLKSQNEQSPLNSIVNGLNKRKAEPDTTTKSSTSECPWNNDSSSSSINSYPSSPTSECPENDQDRLTKRQRKQSCPKKIIPLEDEDEEIPRKMIEEQDNISGKTKSTFEEFSVTKYPVVLPDISITMRPKILKKLKKKRKCKRCSHKPVFKSFTHLQIHKKIKHKINTSK